MTKRLVTLMVLAVSAVFAGCAGHATRTADLPQPETTGSTSPKGTVYLSLQEEERVGTGTLLAKQRSSLLRDLPAKKAAPVYRKISTARVIDERGNTMVTLVLPVYPGDLFVDKLESLLTSAGYAVIVTRALPANAQQGIQVTRIRSDIEQRSGLLTTSGTCDLQVNLELWRKGEKSRSVPIHAAASDYSFSDQPALCSRLLQNAVDKASAAAFSAIFVSSPAPGR